MIVSDKEEMARCLVARHARLAKIKELRESDPNYPKTAVISLAKKDSMVLTKRNHATRAPLTKADLQKE